jgi:acyl-CoA hydrolase
MTHQEYYDSILGTVDDALAHIDSGDSIVTSIYGNEPVELITNLPKIRDRVHDVILWTLHTPYDYDVMKDASLKGIIDIYSYFYIANCRKHRDSGRFTFFPVDLHNAVRIMKESTRKPNVFAAAVTPMDENGNVYVSYDLENSIEFIDSCDKVIFEINKNHKRTHGQTAVPIEKATCIFETDTPLPLAPAVSSTETDLKIGEYVASLVNDGDCIQLGFGSMPNAVGTALMGKHDLGVHSEMINISIGKLLNAGVITNARKNFHPNTSVGAFIYGDQPLYDFVADNENFYLGTAAYVNNPMNVMKNDNFVSINTALEIDLTGQICSESIGSLQFSGTGGAFDFAYGAFHSNGGKGIIAMNASAKNGTISKIKPQLTPGAAVSIPRNIANYVVTEYGIANLRGRTVKERAEALISIAHPDFRSELREQARKLMLI